MKTANVFRHASKQNDGTFLSLSEKVKVIQDGTEVERWESVIITASPEAEAKFDEACSKGFAKLTAKGIPFITIDLDRSVVSKMDDKVRLMSFTLA